VVGVLLGQVLVQVGNAAVNTLGGLGVASATAPATCPQQCSPPSGQKFNKVTHYSRHGRSTDPNDGSHGCMAKMGNPVNWHYDVNDQLPDGRCFIRKHVFGGCGVAPP
jgi:hypothetical protein